MELVPESSPARVHKPNSLSMKSLLNMTDKERSKRWKAQAGFSAPGSTMAVLESVDLCGFLHARAQPPKGMERCPRALSTKATFQLSQHSTNCAMFSELTKCKQVLGLPPSPGLTNVQVLRSSRAVLQGKQMESFPEGSHSWEQL